MPEEDFIRHRILDTLTDTIKTKLHKEASRLPKQAFNKYLPMTQCIVYYQAQLTVYVNDELFTWYAISRHEDSFTKKKDASAMLSTS